MMALYGSGLAPGTHRNRHRQASTYVDFMIRHSLNPASPDQYDVMQFVSHLAELGLSPASINNITSGAKSWVADAGGEVAIFESKEMVRLKRGVAKTLGRPARQAPALSPTDLILVISFMSNIGPPANAPIAALLMAYFTFMRQSNLVTHSTHGWNDSHTIRRRDVTPHEMGLTVSLRSSKTIRSPAGAIALLLPAIPNSILCPVTAWNRAVESCPAPPSAPAFMCTQTKPLDQRTLTVMFRKSLAAVGVMDAPSYTLHSLRRGGARACHTQGVPPAAIMAQGTWESDAVFQYIPRQAPTAAPVALAALFGRATGN